MLQIWGVCPKPLNNGCGCFPCPLSPLSSRATFRLLSLSCGAGEASRPPLLLVQPSENNPHRGLLLSSPRAQRRSHDKFLLSHSCWRSTSVSSTRARREEVAALSVLAVLLTSSPLPYRFSILSWESQWQAGPRCHSPLNRFEGSFFSHYWSTSKQTGPK